jgi:hypothetical protein
MTRFYLIILLLLLAGIIFYSGLATVPTDISKIMPVYAISKVGKLCNCTLDLLDDTTGFELPKVKLVTNNSMQSQTDGRLEWTESKQLALDGMLVGSVYLANQSRSAIVDLNTIRIEPNQLFGLEIAGGSPPDTVRVEILNTLSDTKNSDLKMGDIQVDKKVSESRVLFNHSATEPALDHSNFRFPAQWQGRDAVLLVSLLYNYSESVNNNSGNSSPGNHNISLTTESEQPSLMAIYEAVLSIER